MPERSGLGLGLRLGSGSACSSPKALALALHPYPNQATDRRHGPPGAELRPAPARLGRWWLKPNPTKPSPSPSPKPSPKALALTLSRAAALVRQQPRAAAAAAAQLPRQLPAAAVGSPDGPGGAARAGEIQIHSYPTLPPSPALPRCDRRVQPLPQPKPQPSNPNPSPNPNRNPAPQAQAEMAKAVADGDFERCIVLREKVKSIKLAMSSRELD